MPTFGGIFTARRKSQGNAFDEEPTPLAGSNTPPEEDRGAFRVLNQAEVERNKQLAAAKRVSEKSKFGRFGGFGASGNKARNQSFDEDSPSSSKRDSKSSSGTQFSTSRPYNVNQYGSTSTLPSSANTDTDDNMFNNLPPRPPPASHNSYPHSMSMSAIKKQLPSLPKSKTESAFEDSLQSNRGRAMTGSSYASTAIPPKLDTEMNFDNSGFDDMFSGLDRKPSPDFHHESGRSSPGAGRSLLAGKRGAFQAEPLKINNKLEVEPPLQSWESRGSGEHLITSTHNGYSPTSPPPVPPHKHTYVPVASHSPELRGNTFEDRDARLVRQSFIERKSFHESSPEQKKPSTSSSSAPSVQTPPSSSSASNIATPKAALRPAATPLSDDDEDNLFSSPKAQDTPVRKLPAQTQKENIPPPAAPAEPGRRVLTAAEFRAKQEAQMLEPPPESSDEEDDYDDEEEAIKKRQEEELARRKRQQMQLAREHLRRSTTAPADPNRPSSMAGIGNVPPMGFPSETSLKADEWDDEDVPLGILREHGFPSRGKAPQQPSNSTPSYIRSSTPTLQDRPASAGPGGVRGSNGYRPPFARGLPDDPYSNVIGGGLVQPSNRESMGFGRSGAMSVHGGDMGMNMGMAPPIPTMPYHEPNQPYPSLVEQIHMRDITKQKYKGGASSKNPMAQGGPFTGSVMGGQMNAVAQPMNQTRMPQMPMQGMNPMMGMMGGPMPMMGMNQMAYPHAQGNELMQLQQLVMQQQMQLAQFNQQQQMAAMYGQAPPQPGQQPNQFMPPQAGFQNPNFPNNSFLSVANAGNPHGQRPMSIMSSAGPNNRPYSMAQGQQGGFPPQHQMGNGMGGMNGMSMPLMSGGLAPGYTASIAPSERSNIGLSARYRPVVTGNGISGMDGHSTASSLTLQASGGAADATKVKGILKKSPSPVADDEDDWGKMKRRKNKFGGKKEEGGLKELMQGVDSY